MDLWRQIGILLLGLCLFIGLVHVLGSFRRQGWRLSIIQAIVVIGLLTWLITEILSLFKALTWIGISLAWGIVGSTIFWWIGRAGWGVLRGGMVEAYRGVNENISQLPRRLLFLLAYILLVVSVLGLIAVVAPPNSSDAVTYHMTRVMHWQQNRSLDFYATGILRQLDLGPMAEMAVLNLQFLAGNDRLANLVQFFSMIGCLIGVTLIAKMLGGNPHAQIYSALALTTIPMGILQATSALNDYVAALWLVCFAILILAQMRYQSSMPLSVFAGAALGLALNTKATAYLFAAPLGIWFALTLWRRERLQAVKILAALLGLTVIILIPQGARNTRLFSNPLGYEYDLRNELVNPAVVTSNVLRNLAVHAGTPIPGLDQRIEAGMRTMHEAIGLDINDPRTTWMEKDFFVSFSIRDDLAGNPLHLLLVLLAVPLVLCGGRRDQIIYLACVACGFLLFCCLLKWQPWLSRLHLPLFVLAMPVAAAALAQQLKPRYAYVFMILLVLAAPPYVFMNPFRPVIGEHSILRQDRWSLYFMGRPAEAQYAQAVQRILGTHCDRIGLVTHHDAWEYPIWVIAQSQDRDVFIQDVLVTNISGTLQTDFMPCAIISARADQAREIVHLDQVFVQSHEMEPLSVYFPGDINP